MNTISVVEGLKSKGFAVDVLITKSVFVYLLGRVVTVAEVDLALAELFGDKVFFDLMPLNGGVVII